MRMKKFAVYAAVCGMVTLFCTGCGAGKDEYTKAGMEAIAELDYQTALENFSQASEAGESERLIARGQGIAHLALTQYTDAVDDFTRSLNESNGKVEDIDYDVNYYLATAYYKNGQYEEALAVYDAILALKPQEMDAWFFRGCVALKSGDYETAKGNFDKAIALGPKNYDQMIEIYNVFAGEGYSEVGKEILENAMNGAESSMSDYDKGRIQYYLQDYEAAKGSLGSANKDDDPQIVLYLGKSYEATGDYNYAISVYSNYLEIDNTQAQLFNQLGLCQMKMERYDDALKSFQSGMQIEGNELMQTLKFNEIVAYEYKLDFQTAATLMNEYLKNYPDDETAKREYEFLKTR